MQDDFIWYLLGGLFFHCLILAYIISEATHSKKKNKLMLAQVELLLKMARANGVPEEELSEVVSELNQ